jgi:hypothetical protein
MCAKELKIRDMLKNARVLNDHNANANRQDEHFPSLVEHAKAVHPVCLRYEILIRQKLRKHQRQLRDNNAPMRGRPFYHR